MSALDPNASWEPHVRHCDDPQSNFARLRGRWTDTPTKPKAKASQRPMDERAMREELKRLKHLETEYKRSDAFGVNGSSPLR